MSCPACQISVRRLPPISINQRLVANTKRGAPKNPYCQKHYLGAYPQCPSNPSDPACVDHIESKKQVNTDLSSLKESKIKEILKQRPDVLESFVVENISQEKLEKWLIRVTQKSSSTKDQRKQRYSLSRWRFCVHKDKRKLLERLTKEVQQNESWNTILYELAEDIAKAIHATKFTLHLADTSVKNIFQYTPGREGVVRESIAEGKTIAAYVARTHECVTANEILGICRFGDSQDLFALALAISSPSYRRDAFASTRNRFQTKFRTVTKTAGVAERDERFPSGTGTEGIEQSVLCHPILRSDKQLIGVLEIIRALGQPPFSAEDEEATYHTDDAKCRADVTIAVLESSQITSSYLAWASIGIHYAEISKQYKRLSLLLDFINQNARNVLLSSCSVDELLSNILTFGKEITQAERSSYFEVKSGELYAKLFEVESGEEQSAAVFVRRDDLRFPASVGIAGHSASLGRSLNVEEAYRDSRFNRVIDQKTGFTTRTILSTPVHGEQSVQGVIQLLNKREGAFIDSDEHFLEVLGGQLGMAMQLDKITTEARRLELLHTIWKGIMEYQSGIIVTARLLHDNWREEYAPPTDFDSFLLNHCGDASSFHYYFMHMVLDIAELENVRIDERTLWHFTLTVKSMYRSLEYHNWAHAFSVAHMVYVILKARADKLTRLERLSVLIAAICHDLDHRGRNNAFMVNTKSALGLLYPVSTMEKHHFDVAQRILQRKECNILEGFSEEDRNQIILYLEENILATDLACFFPNKAKFDKIVTSDAFDWSAQEHSGLLRSILMTACDLCATAKSWPVQRQCARKVYHEFYEQGDEERELGLKVMPMMDRNLGTNMPENQIGFINGIALPCFSLLAKVLPCVEPMVDQIKSNRSRWERISRAEEIDSDEDNLDK